MAPPTLNASRPTTATPPAQNELKIASKIDWNEESVQEILDILNARMKDQELTKGNVAVLYFSVLTIGLLLVGTVMATPKNLPSLLLSLLPGVLLMSNTLYSIKDKEISSAIVCEFLWMGAIFSVLFGCLLEVVALGITHGVSVCSMGPDHPSVLCDIFFVITFILCVGFSEELAKILPTTRITTKKESIMLRVRWWHRYVDNPTHFVLFAVASAVGFATLENCKYVFMMEKDEDRRVRVAIMRGLLSVPLHFCCTGIAACLIANRVFKYKDNAWETKQLRFSGLMIAVGLPAVLHGLYDAFIFIAIKSPPKAAALGNLAAQKFVFLPSWLAVDLQAASIYGLNVRRLAPEVSPDMVPYDMVWAQTCAVIVLGVYVLTIVLYSIYWNAILKLEAQGLTAIIRQRIECPIREHFTEETNVAQPLLGNPQGEVV